MTSTARKIEKKYIPMPTWELTPQALTELIRFRHERFPSELIHVIPLTRDFREVLLDYSHFIGRKARNILLLRMASEGVYDEALLTELCERAGTAVLREALKMARRRGEPAVIAVISEHFRESVEDDPLPGDFWLRTLEKFCGLAY